MVDVLKMSTPFPSSQGYAAALNASHNEDLSEFTSCFRFFLESYNNDWFWPIIARLNWQREYFKEMTGLNLGFDFDGYQGWWVFLWRNIPGGGLGKMAVPSYFHHNPPFNIDISKWYHVCTSYSSNLHQLHK